MFKRLTPLLALTVLLAACGSPERVDRPAETQIAPTPEPKAPPWMQFSTCRKVHISSEDIDAPFDLDQPAEIVEHKILAEFPTTPDEMSTGLQGRDPLHPETAMIFEFPGEHNPVLWMKDTPSSLDLVFFDKDGDVFYLEPGTAPNSTRFLTPEEPDPIATHVLELPSGRADELGIFPGFSQIKLGEPQPCLPTVKA